MCVDDHRLIIRGIAAMIDDESEMELVAAAPSAEQAIELYRLHHPDVVLMDLQLPTMSGLEAIRAIRHYDPNARIIVLTMYRGDEDIYRAIQAGARTYLLKDAIADELIKIVREVYAGGSPIPPDVAKVLTSREVHPALTPREVQVLELVAKGLRNKEISATLGISTATAKLHLQNILAKLNVNDRTAAVTVGLQRGIIHL